MSEACRGMLGGSNPTDGTTILSPLVRLMFTKKYYWAVFTSTGHWVLFTSMKKIKEIIEPLSVNMVYQHLQAIADNRYKQQFSISKKDAPLHGQLEIKIKEAADRFQV